MPLSKEEMKAYQNKHREYYRQKGREWYARNKEKRKDEKVFVFAPKGSISMSHDLRVFRFD